MNEKNEFRWADIEPVCVVRMLLKNLWMVVAAALIAAMAVHLVVDWCYTPEYTSTVTYAVFSKSASASARTNYTTASEVAVKFSSMLESQLMKNIIREAMGWSQVPGTITASVVGETNMLQVSATSASPKLAFQMLQAVDAHYNDLGVHVAQNAVLQVLNAPQAPTSASNPVNETKLIRIAALAAGCLMAALLVWFSISRDTVQNRAAARHKLDAELLTVVPRERRRRKGHLLITSPMVSFYFQESFFRLRASVEHSMEKNHGKVLLVSSVTEGEGKSTVAANLALALAKKHGAVLLIDADLRNPTQIRLLGRKAMGQLGLGKLLQSGNVTPETLSQCLALDTDTGLLTLIDDRITRNAGSLLSSDAMARLLALVREKMDYVVIDSPPVGLFADSDMLADLADAAILVVEQDVVSACDINDAVDAMSQSRAKFLGCVLNRFRATPFRGQTGGYGYGYGYGYSRGSSYDRGGKSRSAREED